MYNFIATMKQDKHLSVLLYSLPVPQPIIVIRRSYSGLVSVGYNFTLNAEILFSNPTVVDIEVLLAISWSRDDDLMTSSDRISISNVTDGQNGYTASLTYSPIATSDSGLITATVTVSPSNDSMYIQSVTATANDTLSVEGI